jgi:hypothetical protein
MGKKSIISVFIIALLPLSMMAQGNNTSFKQYKAQRLREFNQYKEQRRKEFEEYRRKRNEEFAEFMRKSWDSFNSKPVAPKPKDETVPPVVVPKDDVIHINSTPKPIPFEEIIPVPVPKPQPQPINPIEEVPITPVSPVQQSVAFTYFGTTDRVRYDKKNGIHLNTVDENSVADAWLKLSEDKYTNLIHDCLEIRKNHKLCDWAYLIMLNDMAESIFGKGTNESVLLMAYVYCQSGYQIRLCIDGQKLILLVGSRHHIFGLPYFTIDGSNFYPFLRKGEDINERVQICSASFPQEKTMSLLVPNAQEFAINYKEQRTIKSDRYPNVCATVKINKNLMSFYNTYPTSMLDENIMTRWAMYANTPLAKDVKEQLYPQLRPTINGKSQLDAVNILLNWVQTGFEYEYDDKVWGGDRAFFAEESLNYPYCDCEDRSILFTRLVRDLLGLKCVLVYYPDHLAAAVCFTESVNGDYIQLNGQRYIVSDPTYIGAPVGITMPNMNNQTAKVILLE